MEQSPVFLVDQSDPPAEPGDSHARSSDHKRADSYRETLGDWLILGPTILISLATAVFPLLRAFYRFEVNYNEGWNLYNSMIAVQRHTLYGERYGWTTVNYPALSFYLVGHLSSMTHDPLLTGRILSLISLVICAGFIALIVRKLTSRVLPALFGASFCLAIFCTQASSFVGTSEPHMLAHVFFLGGFLLYVSAPLSGNGLPATSRLAAIALLFVIGGNIKHNPIDFPLAVLLDLCFVSGRKVLQFMLFSATLIGISIYVNIAAGGPFFLAQLLRPRSLELGVDFPSAITLPFVAALFWSIHIIKERGNRPERAISLLFLVSIAVGFGFGFGSGVAVNTFFSNFLAISIVMGILLDVAWRRTPARFTRFGVWWKAGVPVVLCSCLLLSFLVSGDFNISRRLVEMRNKESNFKKEVTFLSLQTGPAICESLLRCYDANKPYVYDPFNATTLMHFGKLHSREITERIERLEYGAIQLRLPLEVVKRPNERFPDEILDAISRNYVISLKDPGCNIYVPQTKRQD
ncbi:MAG: hypothetical protein ABSD88_18950 [Candidatus Korobacteraceae bacterium]|jgi:hypothetical protein